MRDLVNNDEINRERSSELGDLTPDMTVEVPLREQIVQKLRARLIEMDMGQKVVERWNEGNSLRSEQLERQRDILRSLDEFVDPIYRKPQEWMSNLHLPISFLICKTFHARLYDAMMGQDVPFQVKPEIEANSDRAELIQDLMRYTIKRWANNYSGIESAMDDWIWDWCTTGRGILKQRWDKQFTRFVDVEEKMVQTAPLFQGDQIVPNSTKVERPVLKDLKIFEGPIWEVIDHEDLLVIGGKGDPDHADYVAHQFYMSAHELYTAADQKLFDEEAVKRTIEAGKDFKASEPANGVKMDRAEYAGETNPDDQEVIDRHQILECYIKVPLDDSGIASDVVMWVHKKSREILRATYLWRINKTGLKPFAVIDFHKRRGQAASIGLVEMIYSIAEEMDAMHNMKIDFGLISTMPFGFYKATSSLRQETLPLSPGNLMPLDDIRDVYFPTLGDRSVFVAGEEEALFNTISRITGLSDINFGMLGAQGAARTATGARAVVSESNANLNVYLERANRGFKRALIYLFQTLKEKLPPGLEFRIEGRDGNQYFRRIVTREELAGMYDFEIEPNSAASNPQIKVSQATQVVQTINNPLLLQMGMVTQQNIFEAYKKYFQALGIKDWSRFITPPKQGGQRVLTPLEIANRVLGGIDVPLNPNEDLQGFIDWVTHFMKDEALHGQFPAQQIIALVQKQKQAQGMLQALQAAAAQQANVGQMQANSALATQAGAPGTNDTGGSPGGGSYLAPTQLPLQGGVTPSGGPS